MRHERLKQLTWSIPAYLVLVGCWPSNQLVLVNQSDFQLREIVVSGSGFSQELGTIAPHEQRRTVIRCRGESGLTLRFKAGPKNVSFGPEGYFEGSGGYLVTATVSPDLGVKVKSELAPLIP